MLHWHALILGIVEGITEFLPISSTGHLIIAGRLLELQHNDFLDTFDIFIQLGAMLAVLTVYGKRLFASWELIKRLVVAFIPTGVLGLLFYKLIKQLLDSPMVVVWALALGGVALILFERSYREPGDAHEDLATMPYRTALLIGLAQSVSMIPGVSRAAATIYGGLFSGLSRRAAVEFSFLLALPTMAAASGLDLVKHGASFGGNQWGLLAIGFVVSWFVAVAVIRWLLAYVRTHDFTAFGIYRIVAAIVFYFVLVA